MSTAEVSRVRFGRTAIDYRVRRSARRKTVAVTIDPRLGVLVTAPTGTPMTRLDSVVRQKARWITERLRASGDRHDGLPPREFVSGESYLYLGRHYRLKVVAQARPGNAKMTGAWLWVPVQKAQGNFIRTLAVRTTLESWYRAHAALRLPERVRRLAPKIGVAEPNVVIRGQQKRWASCGSRGILRFNWRIVQAPMTLVDYVVAHELVHLAEKGHTKRFWALLGRAMPDYEKRREDLISLGPRLVW